MVEIAGVIMIYVMFLVLIAKRILTYLHVLQQDDYSNGRLQKWIFVNKAFDKRLSGALLVLSLLWGVIPEFLYMFCVFTAVVVTIYLEKDPRKSLKKKLVATDRAKRIFYPTYLVMVLMAGWLFVPDYPDSLLAWPWIVVMQLIPVVLLVVNGLLQPFEDIIQKVYWNEARQKMVDLNPKVIAITGSFGKTSVKHMLGHILQTQAPTLITPGSVNTAMGITRIIRERLTEDHEYFIVEMGAYGPGSIEGLCELTPPDFGVITSIGHAHYERFRSLDTVVRAKYELAEAAIVKGTGKVIVHERTLAFEYARDLKFENEKAFVVCGEPPVTDASKPQVEVNYLAKDDVHIEQIRQNPGGLHIKFSYNGMIYNLEPPIYGLHHGHNAVLAAVCALELGVDIGHIQVAFQSLPQIAHRLEVRYSPCRTYKIIDDSYNSNPIGFRSALDLMPILAGEVNASEGDDDNGEATENITAAPALRKIVVTPGMIELGIAHGEAHQQIGEYAAEICDIAVVVRPERIPTFVNAFGAAQGKQVVEVESFQEASDWLEANKQQGDIVLIENDLPDMYERIPKM